MKLRTTALVLALSLSISLLSACGGQQKPDQGSASENASASMSAPADQSVPDVSTPDVSAPDASLPETSDPAVSTPDQSVLQEVASLSLNKTDFTLFKAGETYQLQPVWANGGSKPLAWTSSDETVAAVSEDGTVTAIAPGVAIITATETPYSSSAIISASCTVRCSFEMETETPDSGDISAPDASAPSTDGVDLNAFVSDLAAQHGENFAANANVVEFGMHNDLYPGIADIPTKQLVIYQPMMGAVVCEIALAEVTSASDVDAVKAIFQSRIDAQVNGGAWYPESIEGWQNNSRIVTNGNYVMMIAWQFCDDAVSAFNDLF